MQHWKKSTNLHTLSLSCTWRGNNALSDNLALILPTYAPWNKPPKTLYIKMSTLEVYKTHTFNCLIIGFIPIEYKNIHSFCTPNQNHRDSSILRIKCNILNYQPPSFHSPVTCLKFSKSDVEMNRLHYSIAKYIFSLEESMLEPKTMHRLNIIICLTSPMA